MESDTIRHALELAKAGALTAGAAIPFSALMKRMLGPALDEVAERLRDEVKLYRFGRQLRALEKAEQMASEAGFTPQAVPIKLLFPLLEGASLEHDDGLHTMWAALLANAANPTTADRARVAFTGVLKELSPDDALLLQTLCRDFVGSETALKPSPYALGAAHIGTARQAANTISEIWPVRADDMQGALAFTRVWVSLDNLIRVRLLAAYPKATSVREFMQTNMHLPQRPEDADLYLTLFGFEFNLACQSPRRQSAG